MNVVHVVAGLALRTGGVATAVVELARGLDGNGVQTTIFATDIGETASARRRRGLQPDDLPPGAGELDIRLLPVRVPKRLAYAPGLRSALRAELFRTDIVHVHGLWLWPTFVAGAEAERAGVPYLVSPQGMLDPALRGRGRARKAVSMLTWQGGQLDGAACIHFTAEAEARLAGDVSPTVPRAVVPNPIDVDAFAGGDAEAFRARYLGGHTGPIVLNHGRLAQKKGLDFLVEAFALVVLRRPDACLVLAGPDDEGITPGLRARAESLGIRDRVHFTGMLYAAERNDALAAADVWVLPSRTDAWASAVTEALAAGVPVVLSPAVNSGPELERAGAVRVVGLETTGWTDTLVELLDDEPTRLELGSRAREVARRFDRSEVAAAMVEVYEKALHRREKAGRADVRRRRRPGFPTVERR